MVWLEETLKSQPSAMGRAAPTSSGCPGPHPTRSRVPPGMGHHSSLGSSASASPPSEERIASPHLTHISALVVKSHSPWNVPLHGVPSFCCVHCTTQLGVISKLLRVHSIPPSVSLIEMLKSSGPRMDPWGTPLITGLHLDMEPLTTALWLRPSNQFLIQHIVQPSNPSLSI